jgi:hypothetical protein
MELHKMKKTKKNSRELKRKQANAEIALQHNNATIYLRGLATGALVWMQLKRSRTKKRLGNNQKESRRKAQDNNQ